MIQKLDLPISEIIKLYQSENLSLDKIGQFYRTSGDVIKSRLIKAGVTLRTREESYVLAGIVNSKHWDGRRKPQKAMSAMPKPKGMNRFEIFARDGFRCVYCGRTPSEDGVKLILEHIISRSQGGSNSPSNIVTACQNCNSSKRDLAIAVKYGVSRETIRTEIKKAQVVAEKQ